MKYPWVRESVDQLLDRAHAERSDGQYAISLPDELILLVPRDGRILWRTLEQHLGYYRTHVYRNCEIVQSPIVDQVVASPLVTMGKDHPSHQALAFIADLGHWTGHCDHRQLRSIKGA